MEHKDTHSMLDLASGEVCMDRAPPRGRGKKYMHSVLALSHSAVTLWVNAEGFIPSQHQTNPTPLILHQWAEQVETEDVLKWSRNTLPWLSGIGRKPGDLRGRNVRSETKIKLWADHILFLVESSVDSVIAKLRIFHSTMNLEKKNFFGLRAGDQNPWYFFAKCFKEVQKIFFCYFSLCKFIILSSFEQKVRYSSFHWSTRHAQIMLGNTDHQVRSVPARVQQSTKQIKDQIPKTLRHFNSTLL